MRKQKGQGRPPAKLECRKCVSVGSPVSMLIDFITLMIHVHPSLSVPITKAYSAHPTFKTCYWQGIDLSDGFKCCVFMPHIRWETATLALTHFLVAVYSHSHMDGHLRAFFIVQLSNSCTPWNENYWGHWLLILGAMSGAKQCPVGFRVPVVP